MILYLAGPMSGYPEFNYPEFKRRADQLRKLGYGVVNPAELHGGKTNFNYDYYMQENIKRLKTCDAVALMDGWEDSPGVLEELRVASEREMPSYRLEKFLK